MNFADAAGIGNFKLFVSLSFFFVASNTNADAGGDFCGGHADNIIPESGPFSRGNCDSGKRHKEAVGQHEVHERHLDYYPHY